jgi:hypothetical protein
MSNKTFKSLSNGTGYYVAYKKSTQHLEINLCFPGSHGQTVINLNGVNDKDVEEFANAILSFIKKK